MAVKEFKIEVSKRESEGKKGLREIRKGGAIPGIYYSHDSNSSISFQMEKAVLHEAVKSGAHIFNISVGDKKRNVIFKLVQYHPVTEEIIHIDLYGVKMDETILFKVPITLIGDCIGIKEGGILNHATTEIEIECLPSDIPDTFEVDISDLDLGDNLQVNVIDLDESKHKLMSSPDAVLVSITHAMREEEPVVLEEEEDEFLDEDGEIASDDATDSEESSGENSGAE